MSLYKKLPTNQRPLALNVESKIYVEEWRRCWEDKNRDMTNLVTMAEPAINTWAAMLTREQAPDINITSLCAFLDPDPTEALAKIDDWITWCNTHTTVKDQLWYLYIKHVRTANYFPSFANPLMAEYVLTRDFKFQLKEDIKKAKVRYYVEEPYDPKFTQVGYTPTHPDYLLIKNLGLTNWETYLLWWVGNGLTYRHAAETTHIPFDTLRRELRYIWHLLKKNCSRAEQ